MHPVAAKVLILRLDEASYKALHLARIRQETPEFRKLYAKRARIEGTLAQAVRICDMQQARYIGSEKLRLQTFFTATVFFGQFNGSPSNDLLQPLFLVLANWSLLPNFWPLPN